MKTYKIAVAGLGHGKSHVRAIGHLEHAECTAICDVNEDVLQSTAE